MLSVPTDSHHATYPHVRDFVHETLGLAVNEIEWERAALASITGELKQLVENSNKLSHEQKSTVLGADGELQIDLSSFLLLPAPFLLDMETLIKKMHQDTISGLQAEIKEVFERLFVPQQIQDSFAVECSHEQCLFDDLRKFMELRARWRAKEKVTARTLDEARKHERRVLRAIQFEDHSQTSAAHTPLDQLARQRVNVATDLRTSFNTIESVLDGYQTSVHQELMVDNSPYRQTYLAKQLAQRSATATDFSRFTRDNLFFLNRDDDTIDDPVVDTDPNETPTTTNQHTDDHNEGSKSDATASASSPAAASPPPDEGTAKRGITKFGYLFLRNAAAKPRVGECDAAQQQLRRRTLEDWNWVFCILREGVLSYFEIEGELQPQGTIPLEGTTVEPVKSVVPGALYPAKECFKCMAPKENHRTFYVHADTTAKRDGWVELLNDHIKVLKQQRDKNVQVRWNTSDLSLHKQVSTAVHVAFMTKSGGRLNLSWKRRLMVLNGDHLSYYNPPPGLKSRGNFHIGSAKSASLPPDSSAPAGLAPKSTINLHVKSQQDQQDEIVILLGTSGEEDKNGWMEALSSWL